MGIAIVTGSGGLIGSSAARHLLALGYEVIGIDNDSRSYFFGPNASTRWMVEELSSLSGYSHHSVDIRDADSLEKIFRKHASALECVIHCAAQPSHDWAAKEPHTDFGINAVGTLNLLEMTRKYRDRAPFIFTSTNKVYGDSPNRLPLDETPTRFEISRNHEYSGRGIPESFSVDQSLHSIFGASKVAADVMVQEYGRYFGMNTVCFRGGCLTGPAHSAAPLHGFLGYLAKCAITGTPYTIIGHGGKQVRDNIHSDDVVSAFVEYLRKPRPGEVYNLGGGIENNCSILEAIATIERITSKKLNFSHDSTPRIGDHIWYVSDLSKFKQHYPGWRIRKSLDTTIEEICSAYQDRFGSKAAQG
jgi:CDP-paratose 2-epimerase